VPFCATTRRANSAASTARPFRRIERSSSAPSTRPTGAATFWSWSACTTSATLTPLACSASGRRSTEISRSTRPNTCTSATPAIDRSSRVMPGSAKSESCACDSVLEARASETIGTSVSENFLTTGSFISPGRSERMPEMASRISCVASVRFFPNWNSTRMLPKPS
jgi:hypothetical protein